MRVRVRGEGEGWGLGLGLGSGLELDQTRQTSAPQTAVNIAFHRCATL